MQAAVPVGVGSMSAVLGQSLDRAAVSAQLAGLDVDVANDNSDGQVVLSGPCEAVKRAGEVLLADSSTGAARVVELEVSAPFHSRMMAPIQARFAEVLAEARHSRADDRDPSHRSSSCSTAPAASGRNA